MSIQWDVWTGWPSNLKSSFRRRVSAYVRNVDFYDFKIGITNNPKRRFREYRNSDDVYDRMIVIYETSSLDSVRHFEALMIDDYEYSANFASGGGGSYGDPPYFMYVVIRD